MCLCYCLVLKQYIAWVPHLLPFSCWCCLVCRSFVPPSPNSPPGILTFLCCSSLCYTRYAFSLVMFTPTIKHLSYEYTSEYSPMSCVHSHRFLSFACCCYCVVLKQYIVRVPHLLPFSSWCSLVCRQFVPLSPNSQPVILTNEQTCISQGSHV